MFYKRLQLYKQKCIYPHVKLSPLIARLDLKDVKCSRITCGGLHLKYISRNTAARRQIHMPVQDSEGSFPTSGILRRAHALTERERDKYIQNMLQLLNKKSNHWLKQTGFLLPTFINSLVTELYVRWITSKRVQTCVTSLEIETYLRCCTGVVTRFAFIEVLKIKHTRDRSQVISIIMIINSSNNNYIDKEAKWCSRYEIATLQLKKTKSANG